MRKKIIALTGLFALLTASVSYGALIDFEDATLGVTPTLDYDGVTFVGVADPGESYSFQGLNVRSIFGSQVLSTSSFDMHIIQANFDFVTDFVQIDTVINGTQTSERDVISLNAFDVGDNLIGSVQNAPGDTTLSISLAGMSYVQFNDVAGEWGDGYVIDNFEFNDTAPVPEPTTLLLFGAGLAGLAGVSRRKKQK